MFILPEFVQLASLGFDSPRAVLNFQSFNSYLGDLSFFTVQTSSLAFSCTYITIYWVL